MADSPAEDTSLGLVLVEMGVLSAQDRVMVELELSEQRDHPEYEMMFGAYLVNRGRITSEQLELAEIHQTGLRDKSLLVQTRTRVAMAKEAARHIRAKIKRNLVLSEAILKNGDGIKKKSITSEQVALSFLSPKKTES